MPPPRSERERSFTDVLARETARLQAQFPDLADGLSRARALVADGAVFPEDSGREAMVRSSDGTTFYHVNGHCACKASEFHQEVCKHRLALRLYPRVVDRLLDDAEGRTGAPAIPPEYLTTIQGRPYIKFIGLLALAHQRGLQSLTVEWTYNDAELSLAHARAVFPFGTFEESGDSTTATVGKAVAPHWRRMSLVRAKARCLRDALALPMWTSGRI